MNIDRISSDTDYETFYEKYLRQNRPCIIDESQTRAWKSRKEWVTDSGAVNVARLKTEFGCATVPVYDCQGKYYNSQPVMDMKFSEYLDYWEQRKVGADERLLYLKDWHFVRDFPCYEAYQVPEFFKNDWLNYYWEHKASEKRDDYKFVYIGPAGTSTPVHSDVYGSFSWSSNICGLKKWIMVSPDMRVELSQLSQDGQLPFDMSQFCNDDDFVEAMKPMVFFQRAGETVFVPSGWMHQVINVEDTISINHNWFNACNILYIWEQLCAASEDVEKEIADVKKELSADEAGWLNVRNQLLLAHYGMDFIEFFEMCLVIAKNLPRIEPLRQSEIHQYRTIKELLSIMLKSSAYDEIYRAEIRSLLSRKPD
ncbi:2-oxoglutarate and iron-dependent oxygenase JMJD4 [Halotydeus destructor]|nr:2-oxoglutarate and iron-dependent oxygenase JMJD4 [Halotydeus destructor]